MSDQLPDNLAVLYDAFGEEVIDQILPGTTFEVDGIEFVCKYSHESTSSRFYIVKTPELFERYRKLGEQFHNGSIFELGIAEGGSTALLALFAAPRKLVAIDLEEAQLAALSSFIDERELGDTVRPYYGVNQADRRRLNEIVEAEFAGPLDLVIDDASHMLHATRASFNALFPRLRPGGLYLIEDWNAAHTFRDAVAAAVRDTSTPELEERAAAFRRSIAESVKNPVEQPPPMSQLAVELMIARASGRAGIEEVIVDEWWVAVRRGSEELDARTFQLADSYTDYFHFLPFPNQS